MSACHFANLPLSLLHFFIFVSMLSTHNPITPIASHFILLLTSLTFVSSSNYFYILRIYLHLANIFYCSINVHFLFSIHLFEFSFLAFFSFSLRSISKSHYSEETEALPTNPNNMPSMNAGTYVHSHIKWKWK